MSFAFTALVQYLSSLRSSPPGSAEFITALRKLDEVSDILAQDAGMRKDIGRSCPGIWEELSQFWRMLSQRSIDDIDDLTMQRSRTLSIARFTRNLVAENPENQREAFDFEPEIRAVAHVYTSHAFITNKDEFMTTRCLIQVISNLVTGNEELMRQIWTTYTNLSEEKNILIRIIPHPDDRTATTALIFISNCLSGSFERMHLLANTLIGRRLCVAMLNRLASHVEQNDEDEESDLFSVGWTIFKSLFDHGFAPLLLSVTTMEDEIVNPHQTALLKLLDSYLIHSSASKGQEGITDIPRRHQSVIPPISEALLVKFFHLIHNAQLSIRQSLGQPFTPHEGDPNNGPSENGVVDASTPLQSVDVLLPKVCEAIVLVTQCFCTMTLAQGDDGELSEEARHTEQLLVEAFSSNGSGLIENLIELLRLLDAFLPRIMFGKASWSTARPNSASSAQIDKKEDEGFQFVKRDLIRLLGILCYENKAVQDRVRNCDGIPVVMNMCVIDERNPYLREHALFALRNILHSNAANQAVVDAIKPVRTFDDNGIVQDVLGAQK